MFSGFRLKIAFCRLRNTSTRESETFHAWWFLNGEEILMHVFIIITHLLGPLVLIKRDWQSFIGSLPLSW
jgi:hypothetical protein